MSEKELEQYDISLEKKIDNPSNESAPAWFNDFLKEFRQFKQYVLNKLDEHDKLFKKHGWTK